MLRRLFALVVLVALVGAAWYVWRGRPEVGEAEALATDTFGEATQRLGRVGVGIQDARITAAVRTALGLNRLLEPYTIDVETDDGVVTLTGQVGDQQAHDAAVRVASAVPDVRQVVDRLRVDASVGAPPGDGRTVGEALDDRALEARLHLAYSLDRNLQATDIDIQAFRRAVTLEGVVARPEQKQLAVTIARQLPNVLGVTDQLRLAGQPSRTDGPAAPASGGTAPPPASAPGAPATAATPAGETDAGQNDPASAARGALAANPHLAPYELTARVSDGRIVLTGRVRTGAEKDLAGVLAREAARLPIDNAVEVRP